MSLAYRISRAKDQVYLVGKGKVTADECIGLVKRVLADPRCHPESTALVDLRKATYETSDASDIIAIAESIEEMASKVQNNVAILARGTMIFTAELLSSHVRKLAHIPMRVFADATAAEAFCREGRLSFQATAARCGHGGG